MADSISSDSTEQKPAEASRWAVAIGDWCDRQARATVGGIEKACSHLGSCRKAALSPQPGGADSIRAAVAYTGSAPAPAARRRPYAAPSSSRSTNDLTSLRNLSRLRCRAAVNAAEASAPGSAACVRSIASTQPERSSASRK